MMSLSSFLLKKRHSKGNKDIDGDLDALLRSSVSTVPTNRDTAPTDTRTKRRRGISKDDAPTSAKRKKSVNATEPSSTRSPSTTRQVTLRSENTKEKKGHDVSKRNAKKEKTPEESNNEGADEGLEEAYEQKARLSKQAASGSSKKQPSETSDSEGGSSQLVHETVVKKDRRGKTRTRHHVPPEEAKEQRDVRTIFLGNVPTEVTKSKSTLKDLKRHVLSHVPGAKIESMRFRSVAFQRPTSAAPAPRAHSTERTAEWRATKGDDLPAPKAPLGSSDKKRIAFIKHELHADAHAVTVYIVFAHAHGHGADVVAPDEAAKRAVAALDNKPYLGHTLRADIVGVVGGGIGDPKRTVFVGGLDFASREEDLRVFFEGVVSAERGPRSAVARDPDTDDDEEGTGNPNAHGSNPKTWVTRVRIVRDKDTQLGKGFAYVQFADRECVDEILALEPGKLKFAKRKLRVERCKTLPSSLNVPRDSRTSTKTPTRSTRPSTNLKPTTVPKGNPNLGAQLAHLPKAERKAAKAANSERIARRLAKKKARHALPVPEQRKDRVRVRKNTAEHKGSGAATRQKKSRTRSERNVARQNTKK